MLTRRAAVAIGTANLFTAALVAIGVFVGLPTRWWPVDAAGGLVTAVDVVAGVGLLAGARWAERVALLASVVMLGLGLTLVTILALTASWLSGVYGPVGLGGALVLGSVAALALPYLVVLPLVQLVWIRAKAQVKR
jgi:hypothetical protein